MSSGHADLSVPTPVLGYCARESGRGVMSNFLAAAFAAGSITVIHYATYDIV